MSKPSVPQPPSHEPMPVAQAGEAEHAFIRDEANVNEALRYVHEVANNWVLDPTSVTVEQPENQEQLLGNLDSMLRSQTEGETLSTILEADLRLVRDMADSEEHGMAKLGIKAGYSMGEIDTRGLSQGEYHRLRREASTTEEYIDDSAQANILLTGLLEATGSVVLRDDIADGNGSGSRVYKGMLDGKPVYFLENILPRVIEDGDTRTTVFERSVWTETETTVRSALNRLSETDEDVLKSIGVELPAIGSHQYNPETYPNRSRMIETLRLYQIMHDTATSNEAARTSNTSEARAGNQESGSENEAAAALGSVALHDEELPKKRRWFRRR